MMNYGATRSSASNNLHLITITENEDLSLDNSAWVKIWLLDSHLEVVMLVSVILNSMAAGIIFIFSNTVMPSLATLDTDVGINIMNTINTIIVNPLFIIAFFGGLVLSAYPTK